MDNNIQPEANVVVEPAKLPGAFDKRILLLSLTNLILIAFLTLGLFLYFQDRGSAKPSSIKPGVNLPGQNIPQTSQTPAKLPEIDPNSPTAAKYFPGGGNAIDFRDGSEGDFVVNLDTSTQTLSWDKNIQASLVTVYNLGKLDNLTDHAIVFTISPFDINNPPKEPVDISSFIPNPYTIGDIPNGYFNNTPKETVKAKGAIFEKGQRYSIEITSEGKDKLKIGSYTFNY